MSDRFTDSPHSFVYFTELIFGKVDAVICFDGMVTRDDMFINTWNAHQAIVVDILLYPPLRFHATMENPPQNYLLFCCDRDHVEYVKKYFGQSVPHVDFISHVGVMPKKDMPVIPCKKKKYDILFSGTYYQPESMFANIEKFFEKDTDIYKFYQFVYNRLINDRILEAVSNFS